MTISNIYSQYNILPNLQLHMKRTAAVAYMICTHIVPQVDTDNIVAAMLLHDMGNIIKFNLEIFPQFLEPRGTAYWQNVKKEYIATYGNDEHEATYAIARKIGVSERVYALIQSVGFTKAKQNLENVDMAAKICCYADQRVTPFGVLDLDARLLEGRERYEKNKGLQGDDTFEIYASCLRQIEREVFALCDIIPSDISDDAVSTLLSQNSFDSMEMGMK